MSSQIVSLTLGNLDDLPTRCRSCAFWELGPAARDTCGVAGDGAFEKEAWISGTLLEWGSCGKLAYVEGVAAGFILFAPPAVVPGSAGFPTSPVSADAVLLMTAHVASRFQGQGIGRALIHSVGKDLARKGIRALEVFADAESPDGGSCLLPLEPLLAVGFTTVRPHPRRPRLRLEFRSGATWREDVEAVLDRLLGSLTGEAVPRPVAADS